MGENRSIGLKCNKDRWGKGEGLPKYLHEKAIWPKCHFSTFRPVSWTREVLSTASKPSKGERVMVGNGSTAMAYQFIDRMDLTLPLTLQPLIVTLVLTLTITVNLTVALPSFILNLALKLSP